MAGKPAGAGKSSIDLVDWQQTLALMNVSRGDHVLDLACGLGRYSLALAECVGECGKIHAVDLWSDGLKQLEEQARVGQIHWLETYLADISGQLPISDNCIDGSLLATALHDIPETKRTAVMAEVFRVLKPGGLLTVIEFKSELSGPPGPQAQIRISALDIGRLAAPAGFKSGPIETIGPYVYLCQFSKPVCP